LPLILGTALLLLGGVTVSALLWMAALYLVARRTGDAGVVDFGWTAGLGIAAAVYAVLADGDPLFRIALFLVAVPWSFRLAYHILARLRSDGEEDGRYRMLRTQWGDRAPRNFFLFFQFQALLIGLFSIIFLLVASRSGAFTWVNGLGLLVGWAAIAGEAVADRQLARWRRDPGNRGKTCRRGLWRYSRHPNYFFEWLHWWAYVLLAFGHWTGWLTLAGPVLMLLFLYRITGIPYTEQQALKSRGDDYRAYQAETSAFFPWFPRA